MLQFENYAKFYNDQLILKVPDLDLEHNLYWLKGENGSGKTTLIKSISGLIPFDGTISVNGVDINKERTHFRMMVNYAEAEPQYPSFLSGSDLIRFYMATKRASNEQVQSLSHALGIESYVDNKIGTYSSGMAKKLSLVLGLMGSPKLVLLDEPLITLDQQSVATLQDIIATAYRAGVSFLLTSHQEIELSDKAAVRLAIKEKELVRI